MWKRVALWTIGACALIAVLFAMVVPNLLRARGPASRAAEMLAPPATMVPAADAVGLVPGAPPPGRSQAMPGAAEAAEVPLAAQYAARKLIRTGQMSLEVPRYEEAAARVAAVAESHGGYVTESQASRGAQDRQQGNITLRVPAERFTAAFAALKGLGKVQTESVSTQDVTKAYADLETRLRVKRDTAERLRDILRTRTARLSDVLEAERELARVTEEIERMEGERRFYDQQVALSTISVALHEPQPVVGSRALSPLRDALHDSMQVMSGSMAAIIYVTAFLAPWTIVALLAWGMVRVVRRRRGARAA